MTTSMMTSTIKTTSSTLLTAVHDCWAGLYETDWPPDKAIWCCEHMQLGCKKLHQVMVKFEQHSTAPWSATSRSGDASFRPTVVTASLTCCSCPGPCNGLCATGLSSLALDRSTSFAARPWAE